MKIDSRVQLVELMKELKLPLIAVECGVAEGIFSKELLQMGIETLYLIDIWENVPFIPGCASFEQSWHNTNFEDVKEKFQDNLNVIILKGFSYKMAERIPDGSLGLAYIDADHSYDGVKSDINVFLPKLVQGGIIAFHDYANLGYGVGMAVIEFASRNNIAVHELREDGNVNNIGAYFIKQ